MCIDTCSWEQAMAWVQAGFAGLGTSICAVVPEQDISPNTVLIRSVNTDEEGGRGCRCSMRKVGNSVQTTH